MQGSVLFFLDSTKQDSDHSLLKTLQKKKASPTAGLLCTFNLSPEGGERNGLAGKHRLPLTHPAESGPTIPLPGVSAPKAWELYFFERDRDFISSLEFRIKGSGNKDEGITVSLPHFADFLTCVRTDPIKEGADGIPLIQERSGATIPPFQHFAHTLHLEKRFSCPQSPGESGICPIALITGSLRKRSRATLSCPAGKQPNHPETSGPIYQSCCPKHQAALCLLVSSLFPSAPLGIPR